MIKFVADKNRKLSKLALYNAEGLSFSVLQKFLRKKDVKVNGKRVSQDVTLNVGDVVEIYYNIPVEQKYYNELYQDQNVIVIDKKSGCLSEKVYEQICETYPTAKFIHRLDRNTSGVMIFALNEQAEQTLLQGFKQRTFEKKYKALVYGIPKENKAILTAYLLKDGENSLVKIFDKQVDGAVAIKTGYEVIEKYENTSLLDVTLYTGKTHQIRAHLAHIGHFIIGDGKYGNNAINKSFGAKAQKLCSYKLTLKFCEDDFLFYLDGKTFFSEQEL